MKDKAWINLSPEAGALLAKAIRRRCKELYPGWWARHTLKGQRLMDRAYEAHRLYGIARALSKSLGMRTKFATEGFKTLRVADRTQCIYDELVIRRNEWKK